MTETSCSPESSHAADAIRDEVEHIVLHPQRLLFRLGAAPVQHVDVVAALEQELDEALARHHIEDVAAIGGRHHDQNRHAVHFVRERPIVIEIHVPRACRMSFGVEPSAGPEVEKYSTPLMLRWIARWTSDWIRSGMSGQINARGRVHFCSPDGGADRRALGARWPRRCAVAVLASCRISHSSAAAAP